MKVLFLDIDGVVNCVTTAQRHRGAIGIDPYMALLVDRIIQATGCRVVLSSTWRLFKESREEVRKQVCGFIDETPNLQGQDGVWGVVGRGHEIKAWLDKNKELVIDRYAILDDNTDMLEEQMPNFFNTLWSTGLTQEIANEVIAHLNSK